MAEPHWLERMEATRPYQGLRSMMNRGLLAFFRRRVFAGRNRLRVAELACGSGYASHLIAQRPEVDLSIAADLNLEDYRQAALPQFRAAFVLMDLFKPALAPASMDLVWNSSSIEEIDRPLEAVHSMAHLVRRGGWVFVGVPWRYGPAGWLRLLSGSRSRAWLGRLYRRAELRDLMEQAGLEVEHETRYLIGTFIGVLARRPAQDRRAAL